jgi:hypothetical protein
MPKKPKYTISNPILLLASLTLLGACGGGSSVTPPSNEELDSREFLASFDETIVKTFTPFGGATAAVDSGANNFEGKFLKITREGGERFAGVWMQINPVTGTEGTQKISARVYSPNAGIQIAIKLEYGEGLGTGDLLANEVVQAGWQTLTWTIRKFDPTKTYNRFVMLPNLGKLGTGESYYFDNIAIAAATQEDIASFTATPGGNPSAAMGSAGLQAMPIELSNDLHDFISAGDAVFASDYIGTLDGNNRHAAWTNASTRGVALNGNIGYFQDALLTAGHPQIVTSTGWVSGRIDGPASVPNFFRVFVFKKPTTTFENSYLGLYVNAPNNGTVNASGFAGIKFKLWGPAEMYQKAYVPSLQMVLSGPPVAGCQTLSGGTELIQDFLANQKFGAGSKYTLSMTNFRINGLCGNDTPQNALNNVLSQVARVSVKVSGNQFNFQEPLPNDSSQFATGINLGGIAFTQ